MATRGQTLYDEADHQVHYHSVGDDGRELYYCPTCGKLFDREELRTTRDEEA
jgi:hypothetical protein